MSADEGMLFWWHKFCEEELNVKQNSTPILEETLEFAQWFAQHSAEAGKQYFPPSTDIEETCPHGDKGFCPRCYMEDLSKDALRVDEPRCENCGMVKLALEKLSKEAGAWLDLYRDELISIGSLTNVRVLEDRLAIARDALSHPSAK